MVLIPPRVKAFCWLVVVGNISLANNFIRRGLTATSISDVCVLCHREERVNRLFLHCELATYVWGHFLCRYRVVWCCVERIADVAKSWCGDYFVGHCRIPWRMFPFSISLPI